MPKLDKFSFMPQIFWLIVIFFSLYFILLNIILPQLFSVIKTRSKLLSILKSDLLNFGNKELVIQKAYIDNINFFITQSNYSFSHIRYLYDSHLNYISNYIKNVVSF